MPGDEHAGFADVLDAWWLMVPLFSPWSDTIFRVALVLVAIVLVGVPCFLMVWVRTPYVTRVQQSVDQPVTFDHRHHVRDDGIDCLYCHYEATRSPYAGVPPTSVCMGCHGQVWTQAARLELVRTSYFTDEPIPWERVYQLPDFVYFNHSAHVTRGVGCASCHGRVDEMAQVLAVSPLTMQWCLDCHRAPERHLRPLDRVTDMAWSPPPDEQRAIGAELREQLGINPPVSCTGCHR